jgi:hypothetical protein
VDGYRGKGKQETCCLIAPGTCHACLACLPMQPMLFCPRDCVCGDVRTRECLDKTRESRNLGYKEQQDNRTTVELMNSCSREEVRFVLFVFDSACRCSFPFYIPGCSGWTYSSNGGRTHLLLIQGNARSLVVYKSYA